jgi:hypothetical protein
MNTEVKYYKNNAELRSIGCNSVFAVYNNQLFVWSILYKYWRGPIASLSSLPYDCVEPSSALEVLVLAGAPEFIPNQ